LLSVATAGEAAASAFGGCSCVGVGTEQAVAARPGYSGYRAQRRRAGEVYRARQLYPARQMYGAQSRAVVARRAPYQGAQVPRYANGGSQIIQRRAAVLDVSGATGSRAPSVPHATLTQRDVPRAAATC
jgi:hypothetical protein